jgi:hypothetical protein
MMSIGSFVTRAGAAIEVTLGLLARFFRKTGEPMLSFDASQSQNSDLKIARQLMSWPGLIVVGLGASAAGLWFGWPLLVAVGAAPIIVAALPCLLMCGVMCAAILCMRPIQEKQSSIALTENTAASESCCDPSPPSRQREKV